jgi:hypothetical protein
VPAKQGLGFLGGDCKGDSAVIADFFGLQYSHVRPGKYNFSESTITGSLGITSQDVEARDEVFYAAVGNTISGGNGVAVSQNSGQFFTFMNISVLKTDARYGAYPTSSTWYVSAGQWPEQSLNRQLVNDEEHAVKHLTKRVRVDYSKKAQTGSGSVLGPRADPSNAGQWNAQIAKTTDAGKTWSSVYYDEGRFYFNWIDCAPSDPSHCCAAGEGDTSSEPGIRILCTWDGGNSWQQTLFNPKPSMSVMPLKFLDANTVVAAGGDINPPATFKGYFWTSTDGGKTWGNSTLNGVYPNNMAWPSNTHAYATAFNFESTSALLVYK